MVEPRKRLSWPLWSAVLGGFLIFAYPLSLGPALRLMADGYLPSEYLMAFYWPLKVFFESTPVAMQNVFKAYLNLWAPEIVAPY